jgi:ABC-2 type transport system ATP-binding protein
MMTLSLRVIEGPAEGRVAEVEGEFAIGREGPSASVFAADGEISRTHAQISIDEAGQFVIEDLGSTNGTYLNGWRFPSPQVLSSGDRVQVGVTTLEVELEGEPEVEAEDAGRTVVGRVPALIAGASDYEERRPSPEESVLYVDGLRKSYGDKEVLKGIDLEIQPGEVLGLLGPNGAGKTTFVSIVAGLREATSGTVKILGRDVFENPQEARTHLGLAPQDLGIYPRQTVRQNLEFFGKIHGLSGSLLEQRVQETAQALSLDPLFDQPSGTMSGGQQRRLHTAMAMLHKPELLMLDEPTVGADIRTRQEILDQVKRLAAEGRAICYSTHYLPEIQELGASIAMLKDGQIIARGSIADLIAKHSAQFVEITFDGEPPNLEIRGDVTRDGNVLRVKTPEPTTVAAEIMNRLGADASRVRDVSVVQGDLDSVYLSLTEEHYSPGVVEFGPLGPLEALPQLGAAPSLG